MGVLDRFERRLDRMVNGAFARAFKAEVQPVEIAGALQRECDDKAAIVSRGRTIIPNAFRVDLGQRDFERLNVYAEPLGKELGDVVREHAGEQGYTFVGPISVELYQADDLETGVFRVTGLAEPGDIPQERRDFPAARLEIGERSVELTQELVIIGRGSEADVKIDDPSVSRRHAMLRLHPIPTIVDLGSTNGTRVNSRTIEQSELVDGAEVVFGSTKAIFRDGR